MTPKQLKKLTQQWYKKAADSGFKDIERTDLPEAALHVYEGAWFQKQWAPEEFKEKERFFQLATQLLNDLEWPSIRDKSIWTMYTEGNKWRVIAKSHKVSIDTVYRTIKKYAALIKRS